jgi:hypothetical protein
VKSQKAQPFDLFNSYNSIFAQSVIVAGNKTDGEYSVTLTESDKQAKLKNVTIYNIPENSILIKLHEYSKLGLGNKLSTIINADAGVFRCCDYLLATMIKNELCLYFIEMKSENFVSSEVIQQFKGAICFAEYCNAIAEHFFNLTGVKSLTLNVHYVLITGKKYNKTPTKNYRRKKKSTPEDFHIYPVGIDKNAANVFFCAIQ